MIPSVYPRIDQLMRKNKMSRTDLSVASGLCMNAIYNKLHGTYEWKLSEAIAIKQALKTDLPLEELFERRDKK